MARMQDLSGQIFGSFKVLELTDKTTGFGKRYWKCQCLVCNKIKYKITASLKLKSGCNSCCKSGSNGCKWSGYGQITGDYWTTIKNGAIDRNIEFNLTIEDAWDLFLQQYGKCALSGITLKLCNMKTDNQTASIDRIDNNKGYSIDNIQWVHKHINFMKRHHSQDYFLQLCDNISNYQNNKLQG